MTVIVVGAGLSGIACATELAAAGIPVRVLERSDVIGGRMASPLLHGRPVDVGAAYFTVRDPGFAQVVARWQAARLVHEWTDELAVFDAGRRSTAPGPMRWAAPGGLGSLVAELATGLDVELGRAVRHVGPGPMVDGERADTVVLAMPDPQALTLLDPVAPAATDLAERAWRPALVVAAGFAERAWEPLPAAFVNGHPVLAHVADDGNRRGDGAPVLVAHTTAEQVGVGVPAVLAAVRALLGIPAEPQWSHALLWPQASPAGDRDRPFHIGADGIALAGDGWGSSRIETAWRSGALLGRALSSA
ncbi:NAD(P)/FAD-dependent oxidoreductase [Pseudonocardia sp. GCM10023141]|uniref:NAD(P)/FAD-dependent oxidoreductase n=1 Tax=Pseudonocardia sp. GCM10023141 TaxID=3252653 RepID=UPI00362221DE